MHRERNIRILNGVQFQSIKPSFNLLFPFFLVCLWANTFDLLKLKSHRFYFCRSIGFMKMICATKHHQCSEFNSSICNIFRRKFNIVSIVSLWAFVHYCLENCLFNFVFHLSVLFQKSEECWIGFQISSEIQCNWKLKQTYSQDKEIHSLSWL